MKFCTMTAVTLLCTYVTSESENRVLLIHAYHRQRDFVEFEAVSPTSINFVKFLKVLSVFPVSVLNVKWQLPYFPNQTCVFFCSFFEMQSHDKVHVVIVNLLWSASLFWCRLKNFVLNCPLFFLLVFLFSFFVHSMKTSKLFFFYWCCFCFSKTHSMFFYMQMCQESSPWFAFPCFYSSLILPLSVWLKPLLIQVCFFVGWGEKMPGLSCLWGKKKRSQLAKNNKKQVSYIYTSPNTQ